jgi:hypothetical protein
MAHWGVANGLQLGMRGRIAVIDHVPFILRPTSQCFGLVEVYDAPYGFPYGPEVFVMLALVAAHRTVMFVDGQPFLAAPTEAIREAQACRFFANNLSISCE